MLYPKSSTFYCNKIEILVENWGEKNKQTKKQLRYLSCGISKALDHKIYKSS